MGAVKEITLSNDTYKQLYETAKAENEIISAIASKAVADKILFLEEENKTLNEQVNNLTGQLKVSNDTVEKMKSTYDVSVAEIKASYNKMLQNQLNRQKKDDEDVAKQQIRDAKANEAKRVRNKEVVPLKAERDALVEQIDKTTRDTNEKVTELNETVTKLTNICISSFNEILSILNNSSTIEEATDAVDDIIVETKTALGIPYSDNRKPTLEEKIQLENEILELYNSGMSNKEIALKLFNDNNIWFVGMQSKNAMEQKVGRYLRSAKKRLNITDEKTSKTDDYKYEKSLLTNELREKIRKRDNYTCQICGNSIFKEPNLLLEVDHIIPLASGGKTTEDNLQLLCWKCNRHKGKSNKITSN